MTQLYQQHTDATGQTFTQAVLELAWTATQGQPWLVNPLAEQAVWKTPENLARTVTIDEDKMRAARKALIYATIRILISLPTNSKSPGFARLLSRC